MLLLEENLAHLGHHTEEGSDGDRVDDGFVVDGVFDRATADAVVRLQAELGLAESGVLLPSNAVVVAAMWKYRMIAQL